MTEFMYRSVRKADVSALRELFDGFILTEPLEAALQLQPEEGDVFREFCIEDALHNDVSVVALEKSTNRIVGFVLCVISTEGRPRECCSPETCPKLVTKDKILSDLDFTENYFTYFNVTEILRPHALYVSGEFQRKGIASNLLETSFDIARHLGISIIVMGTTSIYSRKLTERMGFTRMGEIRLSDYKDRYSLDIPADSPHQILTRNFLKL